MATSKTPNIDELRNECRKLLQLLEKPEPGLLTWQFMLGTQLQKIAAFLGPPLQEKT